jgi:uncharacterized cofD-like protein
MKFQWSNSSSNLRWLRPGMHVKRWLLLLFGAILFLSLGMAILMVHLYREGTFPEFVFYVTLQFIPRFWRAVLLVVVGGGSMLFATLQLNKSIFGALFPDSRTSIAEMVYNSRQLSRGPKIVAIGGGTGLSTLLRGLKQYSSNITAIVTVADDGGSSGRLRKEMGVLPPGDFRQCIAALADAEPLMVDLFQYRFNSGNGLSGHSFGNLFITAMTDITGNFEKAILESSRVLAVRGSILPSTLESVTLAAKMTDGTVINGESNIPHSDSKIEEVYLEPRNVGAYPGSLQAILDAEMVVIGPGSLFTSILPNLLVKQVVQALKASPALKVYVTNVATQPGETIGFDLSAHLQAIEDHVGKGVFDYILVNNNFDTEFKPEWNISPVRNDIVAVSGGTQIIEANLVDVSRPTRHDPEKLSKVLVKLVLAKRKRHSVLYSLTK